MSCLCLFMGAVGPVSLVVAALVSRGVGLVISLFPKILSLKLFGSSATRETTRICHVYN